jgi:hypothetical protein
VCATGEKIFSQRDFLKKFLQFDGKCAMLSLHRYVLLVLGGIPLWLGMKLF